MTETIRNPHEQRLVFHDRLAQVDRDSQVLAERLAQHYSLLEFAPCQGHERDFLHRSSTTQCGELIVSCGYSTPNCGQTGERQGVGSINLILSGTISYTSEGQTLALNEARSLFFSPGAGYHYAITDHLNAVVLEIDLGRLKRTAAAIAGIGISPRRFNGDLDHLRALQPRSSARSRQLLNVLTSAFRMLDHPELEALGSLQHLQLDDLIYRNLALLLCPQLEVICRQTSEQRSCREQVFEDLLEWIRANLHQPIKLSQLEQQSGYSRRSLQLAFQQRYDCGPIQWVRQQRLEQARQALLQADPDESVAGVGARFGFSSLAVFSRVFRQQFGLTPSQVLREGNLRRP